MKTLNIIGYCAFAASLIALPFLLVNWAIYMKRQPANSLATPPSAFPIKSVSFFLVSCVITVVIAIVLTTDARNEALNFIRSLPGNYTVYVNEQQVRDPQKLISALREVRPYEAHHSHPTKRIPVLIRTDERDLRLELGRDSDNPEEYWVFSVGQDAISDTEIGRITTAAFDEY